MGGGAWSQKLYNDAQTDRRTRGVDDFAYSSATMAAAPSQRKVHASVDPSAIKHSVTGKRESRDSGEHPESVPIIVVFDVTASMQSVPRVMQKKLGFLHEYIVTKGGVAHPQLLFGAVTDAFSNQFWLQLTQFESDNRADEQLRGLILEGGGGGTVHESYGLAYWFAANMTVTDHWEKRGQKGYCNIPESPIWMADHRFKRIGDLQSGDKIMGWRRAHGRRCVAPSEVIAIASRRAEVVEARLSSGRTVTCTADHRWLSGHHKQGTIDTWTSVLYRHGGHNGGSGLRREDGLKLGTLSNVLVPYEPIPPDLAVDAGWLAGIYDGEGHKASICQYRDHNPEVCARIESTLDALGFDWTYRDGQYFILGGLKAYIKLLNLPITRRSQLAKLVNESQAAWYVHGDRRPAALRRQIDRVVDVRELGEREVVSMQTTTGNYVASGYASSNCFLIGDEKCHPTTAAQLNQLFGVTVEQPVLHPAELIAACAEKWEMFHIIPQHTSHGRQPDVQEFWRQLMGERVLLLEDETKICELIAAQVALMEGVAFDDVQRDLGKVAGSALVPASGGWKSPAAVASGDLPAPAGTPGAVQTF